MSVQTPQSWLQHHKTRQKKKEQVNKKAVSKRPWNVKHKVEKESIKT
jgi:hypothetical protein